MALLERKKRNETVKSLEKTILYELDGKTFRNIVKTINKNELNDRLKFISYVPIFESLENIKLNTLASSMFKCTFDEGEFVFYEGEYGDSVYIIKDGELECIKNNIVIRILKSGEFFGEFGILIENSIRTCDVIKYQILYLKKLLEVIIKIYYLNLLLKIHFYIVKI